jgi:hypothetical protein
MKTDYLKKALEPSALEEELKLIQPIVYNDSIDVSSIKNIMLIDNNLIESQLFYDSANSNTFPIKYSYTSQKSELLELFRDKFQNGINKVSFIFHDPSVLEKSFLDNQSFFNASDLLVEQTIFSENVSFLLLLVKEFSITHFDFLACNTLKYDNWRQFYELLFRQSGVICGASNDATGNLHYGGDWIMENTNENIKDIYFNANIENYAATLAATTISNNGGTIYIQGNSDGTLLYSINSVAGPFTSIGSNYPINIQNTSLTGQFLTIQFISNITINNVNAYFVCASSYILFNGLYNGSNVVVTFSSVTNYPGLIQNGISNSTGSTIINNGFHTITVQNINLNTANSSNLFIRGGWLCQKSFGANINNIVGFNPVTNLVKVLNCSNSGAITTTNDVSGGRAGGICGLAFCDNGTGLIDNCSNTGNIVGVRCGGICGQQVGQNGGNLTITNCTNDADVDISLGGGICSGFVGQNSGNVTINNCSNSGTLSGTQAVGICGPNAGLNSGNVTINNCVNSGLISGSYTGGICGAQACQNSGNVTINNCSNSGLISGSAAAGICGAQAGQTSGNVAINNCFNTGNITGTFSGGVCGSNAGYVNGTVTINNCYNTGNISGIAAGGITSEWFGYNTNNVCSITNCYSTGSISGTNSGGICGAEVGYNDDPSYTPIVQITNCYTLGSIGSTCGGILGGTEGTVYTNTPTVTLSNCYTSGSVTDAGSGLIANLLQIKNSVIVTNCYIANGNWSDSNANSSLIGTPTASNKLGAIWYSNQINSPYNLVSIIQDGSDLFNYMSSNISFGNIENNINITDILIASSSKILFSDDNNFKITKI